jgi:hypothetical protein
MPNGIYPVWISRPGNGRAAPTLGRRARVWLRRRQFDETLASGTDPSADRELGLRSRQICSAPHRRQLARALEEIVHRAKQPAEPTLTRAPIRRSAVLDCADDFEALIHRLRDTAPVGPQGVAMVERLLSDGGSPLYYAGPRPLCETIRASRPALDPLPRVVWEMPDAA